MKHLIKKLLREGLLNEKYELVAYHDDVDLSEFDIDEYEAADEAEKIAKDGGVTILRDKELNGLLIDTNNNKVIGAIWVTNDNETFSFDIAIDSGYQNMGLSHELIQAAIDEFNFRKDMYGDEFKMEVDVINPKLAKILANKYGFYKVADISQDRILMSLDESTNQTNTTLTGYKVMPLINGEISSGANARLNLDIKVGKVLTMPGNGIYLSLNKQYVLDYYSELADDEVLITFKFNSKDITTGDITDRETELSVKKVLVTSIKHITDPS